ncbi:MAG: hypothetical protein Q9159_007023 [Coniocarpon cinnabarinum]
MATMKAVVFKEPMVVAIENRPVPQLKEAGDVIYIFPTGFFGARNAFKEFTPKQASEATAVVLGCGPVGLCALVNMLDYKPKHLFAVDGEHSRLELAKKLGAEPLNFRTDDEGMRKRIREVTDGRGADVVVEVVGLTPALRLAFDLVRPWGVISSIGVHNEEVSALKRVCSIYIIDVL